MMFNKCRSKFEHYKLLIVLMLAVGGWGWGISNASPLPCGIVGGVCRPAQIEGPAIPAVDYLGICFCNCLPKSGRFTQCSLTVAIPKEGVFNCIAHCRYKNSDPFPDMPRGPSFWRLHAFSQCARGVGSNGQLTVFDLKHQVLDAGCWVVTKEQLVRKPAVLFLEGNMGYGRTLTR